MNFHFHSFVQSKLNRKIFFKLLAALQVKIAGYKITRAI